MADGWHPVLAGSLHFDDMVFTEPGSDGTTGPFRGFVFSKVDQITRETLLFTGPLGSLLAVRYAPETEIVED